VKFILLHQSSHSKQIKNDLHGTSWIFFSRDLTERSYWQELLGQEGRVNYKPELTAASYALRDEFIEWNINLGKPNWPNWLWWTTRLATRSTALSPLYLYICYIEVLKGLIHDSKHTSLVIVSESWELLELIEENFANKTDIIKLLPIITFKHRLIYKISEELRFFLTWSKFLVYSFYEWIAARLTRPKHSINKEVPFHENHVVIHTCIDKSCMKADGTFHDRYYPGLREYLESHKKKVSVLTWLSNSSWNRFKDFKWLRQHKDSFLLPQDYYNIFDVIQSVAKVIRSGKLPLQNILFRGINYRLLLNREQKLQRRNTGAAYFINYITVFRKWAKRGFKLESFVDTWELKYCEVPSLIGTQQNFPDCRTVGIQHAALIPKLLFANYKTNSEEFSAAPHAEVGITNSIVTKDFLVSEGFPEEYIRVGPALRYQYLNSETKSSRPEKKNGKKAILVCLPMLVDSAIELLWKCQEAFHEQGSSATVSIKFHPFLADDVLIPLLPFEFPSDFLITRDEMEKSLAVTDYLIVAGSAAMIEGLSKNIYTFVLANESDIDLIPADMIGDKNGWNYFTSSEELKRDMSALSKEDHKGQLNTKILFEYSFEKLNSVFIK
jgi:hypothetical protein